MAERFLIRTSGGPNPGTRVIDGWIWPLPFLVLAEDGQYIKTGESSLPPQDDDSSLLRGAEYHWQAGPATTEQVNTAIAVAIKARRFQEALGLMHLLAVTDPEAAQAVLDVIEMASVISDA